MKKEKKMVFSEIQSLFLAEPTNSRDFSGQKQVFSKKKVFAEIQRFFLAEIANSRGFSGQKQVISKNKKTKTKQVFADFG